MATVAAEPGLFTGTSSLVAQLDKKVLVILRDGRHLVGILRTYDQFSSVVLQHAVERHICNGKVGEVPLGLFLVRGENVILIGEIDESVEAAVMSSTLTPAPMEDVLEEEQAAEAATKEARHPTSRAQWRMDDN